MLFGNTTSKGATVELFAGLTQRGDDLARFGFCGIPNVSF
jgi:hypothetical protein